MSGAGASSSAWHFPTSIFSNSLPDVSCEPCLLADTEGMGITVSVNAAHAVLLSIPFVGTSVCKSLFSTPLQQHLGLPSLSALQSSSSTAPAVGEDNAAVSRAARSPEH